MISSYTALGQRPSIPSSVLSVLYYTSPELSFPLCLMLDCTRSSNLAPNLLLSFDWLLSPGWQAQSRKHSLKQKQVGKQQRLTPQQNQLLRQRAVDRNSSRGTQTTYNRVHMLQSMQGVTKNSGEQYGSCDGCADVAGLILELLHLSLNSSRGCCSRNCTPSWSRFD